MPEKKPLLYTFRQAAAVIFNDESKENALRLRAHRGQIGSVKVGTRSRFLRGEDIERFAAGRPPATRESDTA